MGDSVRFSFNPQKGTQLAAYFLKRHSSRELSRYLLLKLIYLTDRAALGRWGQPITGDEGHILESGPVPSHLYDLTNGGTIRHASIWSPSISNDGEVLRLVNDPGRDELSDSELEVAAEIYARFGSYDAAAMDEYCQTLPEHEANGRGGSRPIPFEELLAIVGKSPQEIRYIAESERASLILRELAGA